MSQSKLLISLISSLEDVELDQVAKLYVNEVDGLYNIIDCNGPYDKGLDIRSGTPSNIETQYQITTTAEKRFENKLYSDLKKAKRNVDEYGLPNKVKYFYSYPLTNNLVLTYKKEAKEKHGLVLDLIEANSIAGVAEHYENIKTLLYKIADFDKYRGGDEFFDDATVRSFYDLMSFGSSTDIKYNIIKSFILYYLSETGKVSKDEILITVNEHFSSTFESNYFDGILKRMSTERSIIYRDGNIELTELEAERISKLLEVYNNEEGLLKKQLIKVLSKYNLETIVDEVIHKLCGIYESNYTINLGEFTSRNSDVKDLQSSVKEFGEYIKNKVQDDIKSEKLAKKLLAVADNSELLSRIAAGQVYSNVSDPDRLQDYVTQHNNNKTIFLDTNFLIVALCVHYEPDTNYQDYHFKIAKQFLSFAVKNSLHLVTLKSYAIETASLFKDALDIIPFTKLEFFESLGGSNNVLYRFYKHLKDRKKLHNGTISFEDFLKEFRFEAKKNYIENTFLDQMEWLLNSMNIEIEVPKIYDLTKTKELIAKDLTVAQKYKNNRAITNDAIMLQRLGDRDVEVNPIDPIFCTWDSSLFRVRRTFFDEFPNCTKWLMYTPTRLMDHFSMMNFQVRKGVLLNEVLSILEADFSFQEKTQTLLDAMVTIINPNDNVGLQYANKLAELKKNEILQVDETPESSNEESHEPTPVDIVFQGLFRNYISSGEGIFNSFKEIFTKQEYFDRTFKILIEEISYVKSEGHIHKNLFDEMDILIKEIAEQKDQETN